MSQRDMYYNWYHYRTLVIYALITRYMSLMEHYSSRALAR